MEPQLPASSKPLPQEAPPNKGKESKESTLFFQELSKISESLPRTRKSLAKALQAVEKLSQKAETPDEIEKVSDLFYRLNEISSHNQLLPFLTDIPNLSSFGKTPPLDETIYKIVQTVEAIRSNLHLEVSLPVNSSSTPPPKRSGKAAKRVTIEEVKPAQAQSKAPLSGDFQTVKETLIKLHEQRGYYATLKGYLAALASYLKSSEPMTSELIALEKWLQEMGAIEPGEQEPLDWPPLAQEESRATLHKTRISQSYLQVYQLLVTKLTERYRQDPACQTELQAALATFELKSLVHVAASSKDLTLVSELLFKDPKRTLDLFVKLIKDEKLTLVREVLGRELPRLVNLRDDHGFVPLYYALQGDEEGDIFKDLVRFLLEKGASVFEKLPSGKSLIAYHSQAANFDPDIFRMLRDKAKKEIGFLSVTLTSEKQQNIPRLISFIKSYVQLDKLSSRDAKKLLEEIEDLKKKCDRFKITLSKELQDDLNEAAQRCSLP